MLLLSLFVFAGCAGDSDEPVAPIHKPVELPKTAKIIKDHKNNWVEFELEGKRFLFYKGSVSAGGPMALTQIQ